MNFRAVVQLNGTTATGIEVPPSIVESLGSGKQPAVRVTIGNYNYRTTVAPMSGKFMIPVSADVRANAGIAAGDEVEVGIELDTAPREVSVPADFAAALDREPQARSFFDGLSYSNKQHFVLPIEEAKTAETRQRRIDKAINTLREGRV